MKPVSGPVRSRTPRWIHGVVAALFAIGWLAPVAFVGLTDRSVPRAGAYLNHLWRVSALFVRRVPYWDNFHFEVRLEGEGWREVPDSDLAQMRPFGYCTRLHRVLAHGAADRNGSRILEELARHVRRRQFERHPEATVSEVRFLRVRYPAGSTETAQVRQRWQIPPLASIPEARRQVMTTFRFTEVP